MEQPWTSAYAAPFIGLGSDEEDEEREEQTETDLDLEPENWDLEAELRVGTPQEDCEPAFEQDVPGYAPPEFPPLNAPRRDFTMPTLPPITVREPMDKKTAWRNLFRGLGGLAMDVALVVHLLLQIAYALLAMALLGIVLFLLTRCM